MRQLTPKLGCSNRRYGLAHILACGLLVASAFAVPDIAIARRGQATNFTLRDLHGKHLRLSDYKKKVVLLTFWTTCCKSGLSQVRHLQKLYSKYRKKGFVVLGISVDGPQSQAQVKPMVKRYKLTFPVAIDRDTRVVKLYNPKRTIPFNVLIRRGKVIGTRVGFKVSDLKAIEDEIKKALNR